MSDNWNARTALEIGEARVLFCTWEVTKKSVLTPERRAWLERIYGRGSVERIRGYMDQFRRGELT